MGHGYEGTAMQSQFKAAMVRRGLVPPPVELNDEVPWWLKWPSSLQQQRAGLVSSEKRNAVPPNIRLRPSFGNSKRHASHFPARRAVRAEQLALALGGRKAGAAWMARCPAHQDNNPSLAIADAEDGGVLVRCHAGCDQREVIKALQARGLWEAMRRHNGRRIAQAGSDAVRRTQAGLDIWQASRPAAETLVAVYLRSRGIILAPPLSLRFRAGLKHPSGGAWPAMVALVTRGTDEAPLGIHRTFLAHDGSTKAPVEPAKMMLGPCRGGAVRLGTPGDLLMVGEGIETCLAAMQANGNAAWAALSTSGLRSLNLPREVRDVVVLADGDDPGEEAAQACAWRWKREGRRVRIARPPRGLDFNDLLQVALEGGTR
jgi:hypothetical protein